MCYGRFRNVATDGLRPPAPPPPANHSILTTHTHARILEGQTVIVPGTDLTGAFRDQYTRTYRHMLLARVLEDRLAAVYRAGGKIVGGVYVGRGQEAFSAALGVQLRKGHDVYGPLIRDQAGRIAFGEPILDAIRTYLGSIKGPMRGRDGNIHRGRPREGMPPMISHLGSFTAVINGMLMARRLQGREAERAVGGTGIGDGGLSTGAFHEALNQAAVERLPLVVAVANNQYAYSTPTSRQFACHDLIDRARGYGVRGQVVDGTDLAACLKAFTDAVQRARAGEGPQVVIGKLLRLSGHGEHDDASYVDPALRKGQAGRDCLEVAQTFLLDQDWATAAELSAWQREAESEVDAAFAIVYREALPDPFQESWQALSRADLVEGSSHAGPEL